MKRRSIQFLGSLSIIATLALVVVVFAAPHQSRALSGSEFNPGRIIDNGVFENKSAMGIDQIQQFLNAKMPNCDNWGTQPYAGTTRRAYSEARGIKFPLTCLKDYHENPTTHENNLEGRSIPGGAWSAARIFWQVGQDFNINPQVLIAIMQREQALITDDWPWPIQYTYAMGYGCPDDGPNHSINCGGYEGLYNQVWRAGWQLRRYITNSNEFNFVAGTNNTIQWSPQPSCGTSSVYIENYATAALYNYAPYRPNQAALDNLYGTGNDCSSYANRNFWRYFRDWFGSTYADPFMWQNTELYIMDENKNVNVTTDYLHKGERMFVVVKGKNLGTETWYRDGVNPARLGTWNPRDNRGLYCDWQWLAWSEFCNRGAKLVEESVPPGGTFHFEMYIHAPNSGGEFREYFKPLLEGRAWMTNETGFHIYVNSTDFYDWQWMYFDAWTDSTKTTPVDMNNLYRDQNVYIELKVRNKSATTWVNSGPNATRLGMQNPHDHNSFLCTPSWIACNRAANISESSVLPGQVATFALTIKTPSINGEFREYMKPVIELKGWMRGDNNHIYMNVNH